MKGGLVTSIIENARSSDSYIEALAFCIESYKQHPPIADGTLINKSEHVRFREPGVEVGAVVQDVNLMSVLRTKLASFLSSPLGAIESSRHPSQSIYFLLPPGLH